MHLRFFLNEEGKRVYTLKTMLENGDYTFNAHPARFSPDDQNQKQRFELKKRHQLLPTQQPDLHF